MKERRKEDVTFIRIRSAQDYDSERKSTLKLQHVSFSIKVYKEMKKKLYSNYFCFFPEILSNTFNFLLYRVHNDILLFIEKKMVCETAQIGNETKKTVAKTNCLAESTYTKGSYSCKEIRMVS